jgi:GTP cyclohydrolase I
MRRTRSRSHKITRSVEVRPSSTRGAPRGSHTALARVVAAFLDALDLPARVRADPELATTPRLVAEAWLGDLVDGYRQDPAAILGDSMPNRGGGLVAVTGIDYHSVCPHHLLPSRGVAHVAYVPRGKVAGLGQLVRLIDCLSHRLVLEEDLARQVAEALVLHLGARGAACVLDAEQTCLTMRGERRRQSRVLVQCFTGSMRTDERLQRRFLSMLKGRRSTAGG